MTKDGFVERYKRDLRKDPIGAAAAFDQAKAEIAAEEKITAIPSSTAPPIPPRVVHDRPAIQKKFIALREKHGRAAAGILLRSSTFGREWFYRTFVPWSTHTDRKKK
jgi:hypothetical protein